MTNKPSGTGPPLLELGKVGDEHGPAAVAEQLRPGGRGGSRRRSAVAYSTIRNVTTQAPALLRRRSRGYRSRGAFHSAAASTLTSAGVWPLGERLPMAKPMTADARSVLRSVVIQRLWCPCWRSGCWAAPRRGGDRASGVQQLVLVGEGERGVGQERGPGWVGPGPGSPPGAVVGICASSASSTCHSRGPGSFLRSIQRLTS